MQNGDDLSVPVHECLALIAGIVARTERVRVGSMVLGNTYRHPAVVANAAATIDQMAGGRFVLGIGAGWQVNEHEVYGIELPPIGPRLKRFEEACQVIKGLLTQDRTSFAGSYYQLENAPCEQKPANLPILIGAAGEKVAQGIVARHADEWNHWGRPDLAAAKGEAFARHCERAGRDPKSVRRSAQTFLEVIEPGDTEAVARKEQLENRGAHVIMGTAQEVLDVVAQYPAAGIDELLVPDAFLGDGNRRLDALERLREEVLQKV
jgi:alkanesulfonate monooxygenase SsuD/methylene tetrahydromethanopterin reductase-like flavin-dependent oxidoreductase (luciferase family)